MSTEANLSFFSYAEPFTISGRGIRKQGIIVAWCKEANVVLTCEGCGARLMDVVQNEHLIEVECPSCERFFTGAEVAATLATAIVDLADSAKHYLEFARATAPTTSRHN